MTTKNRTKTRKHENPNKPGYLCFVVSWFRGFVIGSSFRHAAA